MNNNNTPLISIITVCFNSAKTIRRTIESVLNQTYTNIEYIIVDGKSKDNTVAIIEEYASQFAARGIKYHWVSEPDKGIYDAMNKGIKMATGVWVNIQGSDDWLELDACEVVAEHIKISKNQQIKIIYGLSIYCKNSKPIKIMQIMHTELYNQTLNHQSIFVKKSLHKTLGDYSTLFRVASDYDFLLKAYMKNCKFSFIPRLLSNYNIDGISSSLVTQIETLNIQYSNKIIKRYRYYTKFIIAYFKNLGNSLCQ